MKRAFFLSATLAISAGCSPSTESSSNPSAGQPVNTSCPPAYVFVLEHSRSPPNTNRTKHVVWDLLNHTNHALGTLRHHRLKAGQIVEWRSDAGPNGTDFAIAVPRSNSVTWTSCEPQAYWYSNLGGFFPADFALVNAWTEGGNYVVRLQVTNSMAASDYVAWYKIVVPQYDTNATRLPPYDYFMVDATLDVSPDRKDSNR